MRPIVTVISALAVNLHLVLGCCAHHAHGHDGGECLGHVHSAGEHLCSHDHGHDHDATPTEPAAPLFPPHDDCHESHCAYMTPGALVFAPEVAVAFIHSPIEPPAPALGQVRGVDPRDRGDPGNFSVPFYLRHQAFLS
jgi:hypothetical protein